MHVKNIFVFCIVLFIATGASAEPRKLTLQDCVAAAEMGNRDYKMAKLDLTIAEAMMLKAAGQFATSVIIEGGYQPIYRPAPVELPAGLLAPGIPPVNVELPLQQQTTYSMRLSMFQPVFAFGKIAFGYAVAIDNHKIAEINFKTAGEKLKLDVISAFYKALITSELCKIRDESVKRTDEYLKITRKKFESGEASKLDLLRAEVEAANTYPEQRKAESDRDAAVKNLKSVIGIDLEEMIEPVGELSYEIFEADPERIKKDFEEKSDEIKTLKTATGLYENKRNLSAAMLLPSIGVNAHVNYYTYEKDFRPEKEYWNNSWDVTLGFYWEFFNGFKNVADLIQSQAEAEKQELTEAKSKDGLYIKLDALLSNLEQNREIIEAADKTIAQAEEGYKIARENYIAGLIKSVELLEAELSLMQSKAQYLNALYGYAVAVQELKNFTE